MATLLLSRFGQVRLAVLGAALAFTGLAACGETSVNLPLPAARVDVVPGAVLSGGAGQLLPDPIEVRGCDLWEFRDGKVSRKDSYWKIVEA